MKTKINSLILSDTHVCHKYANVSLTNEILSEYEFDRLILVGDVIDFYQKDKKFGMEEIKFFRKLLKLSRTKPVIWVVGNHCDNLKHFIGEDLGNIHFCDEYMDDGVLYIHGHQFETISKHDWLYRLGDLGYTLSIKINYLHRKFFKFFKRTPKRSFSQTMKDVVKRSIKFIDKFEEFAAKYAKLAGCHTVITGHIHFASDCRIGDVRYINCGDLLEGSSFVVEKNHEFFLVDKAEKF